MKKKYPCQLMSSNRMDLVLSKIASEIVKDYSELSQTVLIGIRRRGVLLAEFLQKKIEELSGSQLPLGILDITFYRDDLSMVDTQPVVEGSNLNFDVNNREVLLIDDVLYTGRTTRAALDSILDYGRPKRIELVVLVDRGHRELPIRAGYVGEMIETAEEEVVDVQMTPIDHVNGVFLTTKELLRKG